MATEMNKTYNPSEIEDRLYKKWLDKKYFHAEVDRSKKPFTIVMPPPNITGQLHMGHALDNTLQDILIRFKRMQGYNALWQPGTDHASIATEVKVTNKLREEVYEYTKKAKIYLLGSKREMFPISIIEAMASGVPFISTDVGCVKYLPGGVVVNNIEEMTYWLELLWNNERVRAELGNVGYSYAIKHFTIDSKINELENLIKGEN